MSNIVFATEPSLVSRLIILRKVAFVKMNDGPLKPSYILAKPPVVPVNWSIECLPEDALGIIGSYAGLLGVIRLLACGSRILGSKLSSEYCSLDLWWLEGEQTMRSFPPQLSSLNGLVGLTLPSRIPFHRQPLPRLIRVSYCDPLEESNGYIDTVLSRTPHLQKLVLHAPLGNIPPGVRHLEFERSRVDSSFFNHPCITSLQTLVLLGPGQIVFPSPIHSLSNLRSLDISSDTCDPENILSFLIGCSLVDLKIDSCTFSRLSKSESKLAHSEFWKNLKTLKIVGEYLLSRGEYLLSRGEYRLEQQEVSPVLLLPPSLTEFSANFGPSRKTPYSEPSTRIIESLIMTNPGPFLPELIRSLELPATEITDLMFKHLPPHITKLSIRLESAQIINNLCLPSLTHLRNDGEPVSTTVMNRILPFLPESLILFDGDHNSKTYLLKYVRMPRKLKVSNLSSNWISFANAVECDSKTHLEYLRLWGDDPTPNELINALVEELKNGLPKTVTALAKCSASPECDLVRVDKIRVLESVLEAKVPVNERVEGLNEKAAVLVKWLLFNGEDPRTYVKQMLKFLLGDVKQGTFRWASPILQQLYHFAPSCFQQEEFDSLIKNATRELGGLNGTLSLALDLILGVFSSLNSEFRLDKIYYIFLERFCSQFVNREEYPTIAEDLVSPFSDSTIFTWFSVRGLDLLSQSTDAGFNAIHAAIAMNSISLLKYLSSNPSFSGHLDYPDRWPCYFPTPLMFAKELGRDKRFTSLLEPLSVTLGKKRTPPASNLRNQESSFIVPLSIIKTPPLGEKSISSDTTTQAALRELKIEDPSVSSPVKHFGSNSYSIPSAHKAATSESFEGRSKFPTSPTHQLKGKTGPRSRPPKKPSARTNNSPLYPLTSEAPLATAPPPQQEEAKPSFQSNPGYGYTTERKRKQRSNIMPESEENMIAQLEQPPTQDPAHNTADP